MGRAVILSRVGKRKKEESVKIREKSKNSAVDAKKTAN